MFAYDALHRISRERRRRGIFTSPAPLGFDYGRGWLERIHDEGRERLSRLERLIASGGVETD